eukprot:g8694.t1
MRCCCCWTTRSSDSDSSEGEFSSDPDYDSLHFPPKKVQGDPSTSGPSPLAQEITSLKSLSGTSPTQAPRPQEMRVASPPVRPK